MTNPPKLNIDKVLHADTEKPMISPVTPATVENKTVSVEGGPEKKRRRIGGLPVSALINEKDDETPVPYPYPVEHLPPIEVEPFTPVRPKFPSILYQMSEFVTQLEDRLVKGTLPSFKSLGLPTSEELAAGKGLPSPRNGTGEPPIPRPDMKHKKDESEKVQPLRNGHNLVDEQTPKEPNTPSRKRSRCESDKPIASQPEIESLINTLREQEEFRKRESGKNESSASSQFQEEEETKTLRSTQSQTRPDEESLSPEISKNSRETKPRTQRRGRPNGDNRPRPHACPACQRRFHQQSGVVSHYRVVHLKEKRFECPHKCGLRFGARGDVTRHVDAVHNKIRNFECQVCGDAFARKSILTRHCKNMHHDIFGAKEAHDCVHGCVYKSSNTPDKEERGCGEQK